MSTDDESISSTEDEEIEESIEESEEEEEQRRTEGQQDTENDTEITEEEEEEEEMFSNESEPQVGQILQELEDKSAASESMVTIEQDTEEEGETEISDEDTEDGWIKNATDHVFHTLLQLSQRGMVQLIMIFVVIMYTFFGAFLFVMVEKEKDVDRRQRTIQYIYKLIDELWETAQDDTADYKIWELQLQKRMTNPYFKEMLCDTDLWEDALLERKNSSIWTMENAVYYCFTVFTSVGYGNIVPRTDIGRILTIVYGTVGIPLVIVALADLGNRLQHILENICILFIKFYYIGKLGSWQIRPPILRMWELSYFMERCTVSWGSCPVPRKHFEKQLKQTVEHYEENNHEYEEFKVPSVAALIIFLIVVLVFSYYFSHMENLNFFDSFYFVFITLTLIGFGDIVPETMDLYVFNIFVILLLAALSFLYSVVGGDLMTCINSVRNRIYALLFDPRARIIPAIREPPVPLGHIQRGPRLVQLLARTGPEIKKPGYYVSGLGIDKPRYRKPRKNIWQKLI